jgi:hypothetical protein
MGKKRLENISQIHNTLNYKKQIRNMNITKIFFNLYDASKKVCDAEGFFTVSGKELEGIKEVIESMIEFKGKKINFLNSPENTVVISDHKHLVFNDKINLYSISVIDTLNGKKIMYRLTPDSFEQMR